MVNYIRTLLLNRGREGASPDDPGEEYIPARFQARALPPELQTAHAILLGTDSDRIFRNYRLRQIMTLLHNSDYGYLVTAGDPRVTYWPFNDAFYDQVFGVVQTPIGHDSPLPFLAGAAVCDEGRGRCVYEWLIRPQGGDRVRIDEQRPSPKTVTLAYDRSGSLSGTLTLPDSSLKFRVPAGEESRQWLVTATTRPPSDIGIVLSRLFTAVSPRYLVSFLGNPTIESYWDNAQSDQQRFALALLGLASGIAACEVAP